MGIQGSLEGESTVYQSHLGLLFQAPLLYFFKGEGGGEGEENLCTLHSLPKGKPTRTSWKQILTSSERLQSLHSGSGWVGNKSEQSSMLGRIL